MSADISGRLIGLLRRLIGRANGEPRFSENGQRVHEQSRMMKHMPEQLQALTAAYPNRHEPIATRAELELEDGDAEGALATAAALRERFPGLMVGYHFGCTALRRLRRMDEAEALARAAMHRFPRSPGAFEAYAFCAQERSDWPEAARRWHAAARRFPESLWSQAMRATSLARQGQHDAAEQAIARIARKWPKEWWPGFFAAEIAELAENWELAGNRWVAQQKRFPGRSEAYVRGARAFRQAGALDRAGTLIAAGIFIFPRDPAMLGERQAVIAAGGDAGPAPPG